MLGTLFFVVCLYTYNLTRLLSPLFYISFIAFNFSKVQQINRKWITATVVVTCILLFPFIKTFLNQEGIGSSFGTLIFSSAFVHAPLIEFRSYLVGTPILFSKLFFNTPFLIIWQYMQNIVSYFSVSFFFISGSAHGNHGIGNVGQFYLFELPFIILGIISTFKAKRKWMFQIIGWAAITILVASLTRDVPHATRSFFLIVPFEIFSAIGLVFIFNSLKNITGVWRFYLVCLLFIFLSMYNIVYYITSYYIRFPIYYAKAWRKTDKALSLYIKQNENKYKKVIIDRNSGFAYSSLLFYTQFPPSQFQKTVVRQPDDSEGFSDVSSFGKYEIRDIDWQKDYLQKDALLITTLEKKPKEIPIFTSFYYPKRPVVLADKQKILQYPVEEVSYVVIQSKEK